MSSEKHDVRVTVIESQPDIRATLFVEGAEKDDAKQAETNPKSPRPFRPVNRPPMAIIRVMDDNQISGRLERMYTDTFRIGRVSGDIVIPHDTRISSTHAEVTRRQSGDGWTFSLRDLKSTNGTFAKIRKVLLRDSMGGTFGVKRTRHR